MKSINTYNVIFEFRTYVDENIADLIKQLSFIPSVGMNIFIDEEDVEFPEQMGGGWFKAEDVDYILKEDVFVVSLKDTSEYVFKEE